jgi:hypothetical protein
VYFFAIETTRRRLASTSSAFAPLRHPLAVLISWTVERRTVLGQLRLFLDALDLLVRVLDDARHLLDLFGADAQLLGHRALAQRRRPDLAQRLAELLQRQARLVLAVDDLAVGLLDRSTRSLSLRTILSICFLFSRISWSASRICWL